jgi:hypothetical protein
VHENVTEPPVERQVAPARAAAPSSLAAMGTPAAVIALQRSAGNRAVAATIRSGHIRALARCAGHCTCGGACDEARIGDEARRPARGAESTVALDEAAPRAPEASAAAASLAPAARRGAEARLACALSRVPGNRARAALVADRRRLMREESDADRPGEEPGRLAADVGESVAQPEPDAASPAEPTTTPATGDAAVKCRIDSFTHKMGPWNVSWPWTWTTKAGQNTTIRLPVKFNLLLSKGCNKEDCRIGQRKKGETLSGGDKHSWPSFIQDGHRFWWDGANWTIGSGSWSGMPGRDEADFADEPGFQKVPNGDYPLYWGGVGGSGCFVFETWVADKKTGKELKSIGWNMRIDYKRPEDGSHGSCK